MLLFEETSLNKRRIILILIQVPPTYYVVCSNVILTRTCDMTSGLYAAIFNPFSMSRT